VFTERYEQRIKEYRRWVISVKTNNSAKSKTNLKRKTFRALTINANFFNIEPKEEIMYLDNDAAEENLDSTNFSSNLSEEVEHNQQKLQEFDAFKPNLEWMHLSEQSLVSNFVYSKYKNQIPNPRSGCLSKYLMGIICSYFGYKDTMTTLRYLSKSWVIFTQDNLYYIPDLDTSAVLKVSAFEVYQGEKSMPLVTHPYYTNCTELDLIYQLNSEKANTGVTMQNNYEIDLFPKLLNLSVKYSHCNDVTSVGLCYKRLSHYQYLLNSPYLKNLEYLAFENTSMNVNWRPLKLITKNIFPNLKEISLPLHSMVGIRKILPRDNDFRLEGVKINLKAQLTQWGYYNSCFFYHYYNDWIKNQNDFLRDVMLFNDSQRLDIDFGESTNGDFFEYLQKMSWLVYNKETSYQYDQIRNMTSLNLENCAMTEKYF
jgi:hypothetical protein